MIARKIAFALAITVSSGVWAASASELAAPQTAPAHEAATQSAVSNNKAVVEKGLTTATVTVPASSEPQKYQIDVKPLIDGLLPYIISAVGGIIVVLGGLITAFLKQKWNIDIDSQHREAWQQSTLNAASALIAKGAVTLEKDSGKVTIKNQDMANAINTVMSRVPDAIAHFGFSPADVEHLIIAKVPQVLTAATPGAGPAQAPVPQKAGA